MTMSIKKTPALLSGLLLLILPRFVPGFGGLSRDAMQVLGIFLGTVVLWLFVDISWPSILALLALSLLPGVTSGSVIAASFGNPTIWFLVFSFLITFALGETGFLRRLALIFLSSRLARRGAWLFIFMFLLAVLVLGSFIAPTVTFLLYFALHKEVSQALGLRSGSALARVLMIGTACVTSISCAMTPIAHTFPLMAIGFHEAATGETISYLSYMKIGLPSGILLFLIVCGILYAGFRKRIAAEAVDIQSLNLTAPGRFSARELFSAVIFLLVILAWLLSGVLPKEMKALADLGVVWPAMAGVVLLSAVPVAGKPVLDIKKGMIQGVS